MRPFSYRLSVWTILLGAALAPGFLCANAPGVARAVCGGNEIRLDCAAGTVEIVRNGLTVVVASSVDLVVDGRPLSESRQPVRISTRRIAGTVPAPVYKKSAVDLEAEETFADFGDWGIRLIARPDGAAYRFETRRQGEITVDGECADIQIPGADAVCWYAATPEFGCEETVPRRAEAAHLALATNEVAYLPFVYSTTGTTVAVMDADVRDYPFLYLAANGAGRLAARFECAPLKTKYAISPWVDQRPFARGQFVRIAEHAPYLTRTKGARTFPWRVFALADTPAHLCEADIVWALSAPADPAADFSWVKPGKAAWEWWNDWDNRGKAAGCNTATYRRFIDFAATNAIEYVILDGGWSDGLDIFDWNDVRRPWKFSPKVDVPHLVAYATERNVGLVLWLSWAQACGDEATVARRFAQLGVKGLKVDFIDRGDAESARFMERFAAACAAERLVVDFHGACRPTGLSRAYPNVLNYEGVHGLEQMKWYKGGYDMMTADVRAFYLRLTAGPMDYTPGAMLNHPVDSPYLGEKAGNRPGAFGTRSRQMAMMALFEAPLQMLCDSPTNYERNGECFRFMSRIPVVWSNTVALAGSPDTVAACARQSKDGSWYAAGIGTSRPQPYRLRLPFLGEGAWEAEIFRDAADSDREPTHYVHERRMVARGDELMLHLAPGGGFVIQFKAKEHRMER